MPQEVRVCPRCSAERLVPKPASRLGFTQSACLQCGFQQLGELTANARTVHRFLLICIAIASLDILVRGYVPLPGGLGLLILIVSGRSLWRDRNLRKLTPSQTATIGQSTTGAAVERASRDRKPARTNRTPLVRPAHLLLVGFATATVLVLFPPYRGTAIERVSRHPSLFGYEALLLVSGVYVDTSTTVTVDTTTWTIPFGALLNPPETPGDWKVRMGRILETTPSDQRDALLETFNREYTRLLERSKIPAQFADLSSIHTQTDTVGGRIYNVYRESSVAFALNWERLLSTLLAVAMVTGTLTIALSVVARQER